MAEGLLEMPPRRELAERAGGEIVPDNKNLVNGSPGLPPPPRAIPS